MVDGEARLVPSSESPLEGAKPFPSVVSLFKDGGCLIGSAALEQHVYNPEGTILNVKRMMGSGRTIRVFGKDYLPQFISALLLMKIKIDAAKFLGEEVTRAVITVPANFNDVQRQATRDAGSIAGLDVVRLIPEPVAAAVAYGAGKLTQSEKVLVFDMGAGTLDVSVIEADGHNFFEVLATSGPTDLGGIDMTEEIVRWLVSKMGRSAPGKQSQAQIRDLAERLKVELSGSFSAAYDEIITVGDAPVRLSGELTRPVLEGLIRRMVDRSEEVVLRVLDETGLAPSEISRVVTVGGPTRMPAIREMLTRAVQEPEAGVDPDFAVSIGAAIEGAVMGGDQHLPVLYQGLTLLNVTPLDLGEEAQERGDHKLVLMIPKNTPYPTERTNTFYVNRIMQTRVKISIWQGDFERNPGFLGNVNIGTFTMRGLRAGLPNEVEVTYGIDSDGILTVKAREIGTGTVGEIIVDKAWGNRDPAPQLECIPEDIAPFRKRYLTTMNPGGTGTAHQDPGKGVDLDWMCECLEEAKGVITEHHTAFDPSFFDTARFELFLQLDMQYAYAYIVTGGPVYPIGIHNSLKEPTRENRRMLVITLVHELLHAIHPDWGHNRINPEERRLANLACYFDTYREKEIKFLSGQMSICNNLMTASERRIRVRCGGQDDHDGPLSPYG